MRQGVVFTWFGLLLISLVISSCTGPIGFIRNEFSKSPFTLTVTADRKCELEINGVELAGYTYESRIGSTLDREFYVVNSCVNKSTNSNDIYISSMYPNVINPPLAYANLQSEVSESKHTEHLYYEETKSFPITDRWKAYGARLNADLEIDSHGELQLAIPSPDWKALSYKQHYGRGFAICGYALRAFEGKVTFYGARTAEINTQLFKIVGSIKRVNGGC